MENEVEGERVGEAVPLSFWEDEDEDGHSCCQSAMNPPITSRDDAFKEESMAYLDTFQHDDWVRLYMDFTQSGEIVNQQVQGGPDRISVSASGSSYIWSRRVDNYITPRRSDTL